MAIKSTAEAALDYLKFKDVVFSHVNGFQYKVEGPNGFIDYWPNTGTWVDRKTKQRGFGAKSLTDFVNGTEV